MNPPDTRHLKDCFRYQLLYKRLTGDLFTKSTTEDVRAVAWVDADSFSLKNLDTLLEVGWGLGEGIPPTKRWWLEGNPSKMPETNSGLGITGSFAQEGWNEVGWLWGMLPFVRLPFGYVSGDIFFCYLSKFSRHSYHSASFMSDLRKHKARNPTNKNITTNLF